MKTITFNYENFPFTGRVAPKEKEPMNYFAAITYRCDELNKLGQTYLDRFEFISNPDILDRLWKIANDKFDTIGRDWNKIDSIPEWMGNFLDGWIPYGPSKNGSLFYTMGRAEVSVDAHLRNLLERAEGRETKELDFPTLVEHEVVDRLSGLTK